MDPFTQRMLERAKARREKLDTQLSNAGHDVPKRRSPLRDANDILSQTPVITGVIAKKSPVKMVKASETSPTGSPAKTIRKFSPEKFEEKTPKKYEEPNKENDNNQIDSVKSKLQRLGKLYSEDNRELSSPIHRTEEKFAIEEIRPEQKSAKPMARLNRLAALASEINNWEDDLSHPTAPTLSKAERVQAKLNEQVRNGSDSQPSTSSLNGNGSRKSGSPLKPMKWDKVMLESLGTGGSQQQWQQQKPKNSSPAKSPAKSIPMFARTTEEKSKSAMSTSPASSTLSNDSASSNNKTPEKQIIKSTGSGASSPAVSNARLNSRFGYKGSPNNSAPHLQSSPGSVLSKASMFESKGSATKTKDPAEMTLSERKALFERNKGEALIPKAPLTMSVPTKMLQEKEKQANHADSIVRSKIDTGRAVEAQRSIFEQGIVTQELENNILLTVQTERQRELEMLRSRFNRHVAQTAASTNLVRTSESSEGGKPGSPKYSPVCPVKPTTATDQAPPPPPPPMPNDTSIQSCSTPSNVKNSPTKRQVATSPPKPSDSFKKLVDVKRAKVSPPKTNRLYPDLRHIESTTTDSDSDYTTESTATLDAPTNTETEAEYYVNNQDDDYSSDDYDDDEDDVEDDDLGNTSLGRSILQVASQSALHKKRSIEPDPDSTTSDISVLDEMDEYLDECLALQDATEEGPTPPKLNRNGKSPSSASNSFKYMQGSSYKSPIKIISPASSPRKREQYVVGEGGVVPLMHSVSFYRKQQSQTPKTPARVISHKPDDSAASVYNLEEEDKEAILVQDKVKRLLDEVQKQQTIIGQASQALNLCHSTIEFSDSREQVEGERLLLLATHRRQAALNEVQRLKVEGTLRPVVPGAPEVQESGSLTISAITLPFKKDYFHNIEPETCLHFVCLIRYLDTVIATPVIKADSGDSCLRFPSTLKLQDLYSDFKVTIEIYSLQTRAEILPHDIKYHIHSNGSNCSGLNSNSKKSGGKTPKKFLKQESKLTMPNIQSPAGPLAVRTTNFKLAGYVVFSLKEVHRQQFTLNKVPLTSPLEGRLQMHVSCELTVSVDHHGFLTMFEDVSGFGAWHRRWCQLQGALLSYWKYPDDERKKTPIGTLDLRGVSTTNVTLVSRDICARPNTFLLETTRPAQPGDADCLVMARKGSETTIRHLLSADTKEERLEWCAKLNKTLNLIRAWGGPST
ncbi:anillin-like isoform X2 [Copidosoma floridanum]|uniref:anillin-like isoform X2 n=1 Tax=Copidosoma floridanum TaxID=29053 RepID=UPI0006C98718|nr:anillin-like isoform X2 [Copidosoma floridanum]